MCSRNQWRSPTAEKLWRNHVSCCTRSAGTSTSARHRVSAADIQWADIILVMENKHKSRLKQEFSHHLGNTPTHVLDIPDIYQYMDAELVEILRSVVPPLLEAVQNT